MRIFFLACVLGLVVTGCASLTSGGNLVLLTKNANDVQGCATVGEVSSHPPYVGPNDWKVQLRNETAARGGDRVLAGDPPLVGNATGTAYRCANVDGGAAR